MVQLRYQNPEAEEPLFVPVLIEPNTHEDTVDANIRANAATDAPWFFAEDEGLKDRPAVICGGGPSLVECVAQIRELSDTGSDVIALNGAAGFLIGSGVPVDAQVIIDAQEVTAGLVAPDALRHVFASHVSPETLRRATNPTLFHLNFADMEDLLPPEKVAAGGYSLVGGGVSVGITALVVAYLMGYRELHLFGYDSSNRRGETHAYHQPHNKLIPTMEVEWGGRTFTASLPMKLQAEAFPKFARQLQDEGVTLHVHGDGLLPAIWHVPPATEREKYQLMWMNPDYGRNAPGEWGAPSFLEVVKPDGTVIDLGCGTGKGAMALAEAGCDVLLVDFTDNCRVKEALGLPFLQWDLSQPLPVKAPYGFCTDVMEHIPPEQVDTVLANIFECSPNVWFQIATVDDAWGAAIGQKLHLSVHPWQWWNEELSRFGRVAYSEVHQSLCRFYIRKES